MDGVGIWKLIVFTIHLYCEKISHLSNFLKDIPWDEKY
jgi:hypothetical protein